MTSMLNFAKTKLSKNCLTHKIEKKEGKKNCKLRIGIRSEHIIVDLDDRESPMGKNEARPDYLYICESSDLNGDGFVLPIEISTGQSKGATHITRQLQAGAKYVANMLDSRYSPTLLPVYVGKLKRTTVNTLRRSNNCTINFRGKKMRVLWATCGSTLSASHFK